MNRKLRGCLSVFAGFFVVLVILGFLAGLSGERADDNAKAVCAAIPVGSTLAAAQAIARKQPNPPKELDLRETYRLAYHGALFHQAECNLEMKDGVVVAKTFGVDDY